VGVLTVLDHDNAGVSRFNRASELRGRRERHDRSRHSVSLAAQSPPPLVRCLVELQTTRWPRRPASSSPTWNAVRNLPLTLADKVGVHAESINDGTGDLDLLDI